VTRHGAAIRHGGQAFRVSGTRRTVMTMAIPVILLSGICVAQVPSSPAAGDAGNASATLTERLERYFQTPQAKDRQRLLADIEAEAGGDAQAIAALLPTLQFWKALPTTDGRCRAEPDGLPGFEVVYRLPPEYSERERHTVLVCVPGPDSSPDRTFDLARHYCGDTLRNFVLAAPTIPLDPRFHAGETTARQVAALLYALRRTVHRDAQATFLFGAQQGADAGWMVLLGRPLDFAGAMLVDGAAPLPYPRQVYPLLLDNLRQVPVVAIWRNAQESEPSSRVRTVDAHHRLIAAWARQHGLPITALPYEGRLDAAAVQPALTQLLASRRAPNPVPIQHRFRFPAQGHADWLHQDRFRDDPWTDDQLSILVAPGVDADEFITGVIRPRLALLAGRIEGQHITVSCARCNGIEIELGPGAVDFAQPVELECNGQKRHERLAKPSCATLLETAYQRWDFQNLVLTRLSVPVRSDARGD